MWPVGICGGLRFEGPLCKNDKVTGWHTGWALERPFPIDMAGVCVCVCVRACVCARARVVVFGYV